MKRLARAVAVALALTGIFATTAISDPSSHKSIPPSCTAKTFRGFSAAVWNLNHWQRGEPGPKAIAAQRHRLSCAGPGNRAAMRRIWHTDKSAYFSHRGLLLATRCGTASCNQRLGWLIASHRGISRSEFDGCLIPLWDRESEWDEQAWNSSSGAGGIPQGLPASKMGADADPGVGGWRVAAAQIKWGLDYLAERYGGPCGGWAHSNAAGWY